MSVTRNTILDLANQAASEKNHVLRILLLTVAGMMDAEGGVPNFPATEEKWEKIFSCNGAFGLGLLYLQNRGRRLDVELPKRVTLSPACAVVEQRDGEWFPIMPPKERKVEA